MRIRSFLKKIISDFKKPKMIWGYHSADGVYRSKTRISDTVSMYKQDNIYIADNVFIWHFTIIDGTCNVEIGEGSQIGSSVGIFTHSSHLAIRLYGKHYTYVKEEEKKAYQLGSVKIGKYVTVASGSKILPGVTIGDGSIIGVNSVVSKDVPPYSIVSGNPGKLIGDTRKVDAAFLKIYPELKEYYYDQELLGSLSNDDLSK